MAVPKKVVYAGETFWLQSSGRYYQSGRKDVPERLLHRRIYADQHGPIPPGFAVHHVNGDWQDNHLENLVLVSSSEHARAHLAERVATTEGQERAEYGLVKAREAAKLWHASPEGRMWHAQHGKATWMDRTLTEVQCQHCEQPFLAAFPTRARFCSKACCAAAKYRRNKLSSGICPRCKKRFFFNRYRQQTYCSRACAILDRFHPVDASQPDF